MRRAAARASIGSMPQSLRTGTAAGVGVPGPMVVVVDDDDGLRLALTRVLRACGFEVRAFANAEDALQAHGTEPCACLVVDLQLPRMSGLELTDRLRERGSNMPVVVISAHDEAHVRKAMAQRGIEHFLAKPFHGSTLAALVRALIGERRSGVDAQGP
jgi:FixJ family two-component response regulator